MSETLMREILASALFDAENGSGMWELLTPVNRARWLHRADDFIHELAMRDHIVVAMEGNTPLHDGADVPVTPNMVHAALRDCPAVSEHDAIMVYRVMAELDPERRA